MRHSSNNVAVSVRGLNKSYTIAHQAAKHSTFAEAMLDRVRHPFRREERETFEALKDVSFDIKKGEVVGIIGRNGAGKSTLLKILSRITEPTTGEIDLYGRVGSLLEVGTGFHPELTGRENIFLNGAILGMSRAEIRKQFDAIVDFSGVEQFLDTPVKRYSSGMYVRLAFAVAAHLESEIMVVDEVLAVGDTEFQRKCLGKMKDVAGSGRTVLFVSHHMQSVSVLCTKAIFLERGRVTYLGDVPGAIDRYVSSFEKAAKQVSEPHRRPGTGEFRFTSATPSRDYFECDGEKTIRYSIERTRPFAGKFFVSCHIVNELGATLVQCDSRMVGHWLDAAERIEGQITIRTPWLMPGNYRVDLFLCSAGVLDAFEHACTLNVIPLLPYPAAANSEATCYGVVFADFAYDIASRVTDLSGSEALGFGGGALLGSVLETDPAR
jgi:lipopolysaccharide transport system ATP-binding protein